MLHTLSEQCQGLVKKILLQLSSSLPIYVRIDGDQLIEQIFEVQEPVERVNWNQLVYFTLNNVEVEANSTHRPGWDLFRVYVRNYNPNPELAAVEKVGNTWSLIKLIINQKEGTITWRTKSFLYKRILKGPLEGKYTKTCDTMFRHNMNNGSTLFSGLFNLPFKKKRRRVTQTLSYKNYRLLQYQNNAALTNIHKIFMPYIKGYPDALRNINDVEDCGLSNAELRTIKSKKDFYKKLFDGYPVPKVFRECSVGQLKSLAKLIEPNELMALERPFKKYLKETLKTHSNGKRSHIYQYEVIYAYYKEHIPDIDRHVRVVRDYCSTCYRLGEKVNLRIRSMKRLLEEDYLLGDKLALKNMGPLKVFEHYPEFNYLLPGGVKLERINTTQRLVREGRMMRHCVASYGDKINQGNCAIYHVSGPELDETGGYTLEVVVTLEETDNIKLKVVQLLGYQNCQPPPGLKEVIQQALDLWLFNAPDHYYFLKEKISAKLTMIDFATDPDLPW